jgi:hypothetical protein
MLVVRQLGWHAHKIPLTLNGVETGSAFRLKEPLAD